MVRAMNENGRSSFAYIPNQKNCMLTIDITTLVRAWVNGTFNNYGLLL
jgi:hypothetical protein